LLLNPPDLIEVAFGPGSFEKHRQAAETAGLEPIIYRSPTLAFDLDLPEDWEGLREQAADQNEGYSGWSGFGRI
jgi:2-phospho-L-lactate guanylyltransferase